MALHLLLDEPYAMPFVFYAMRCEHVQITEFRCAGWINKNTSALINRHSRRVLRIHWSHLAHLPLAAGLIAKAFA